MGTHGLSGFERLMMGLVAEKVLRKASCPVMTEPPDGLNSESPVQAVALSCGVLRLLVGREAPEGDRSDLVIMGVHGQNPLDLAVFGSTANHVARGVLSRLDDQDVMGESRRQAD